MLIRAALVAVLLTAVGCSSGAASDPNAALRVGVSPTPHGEILKHVADTLAKDKGLRIEIVEFTDYVQPNTALVDGSLDANYFQTVPYLESFTASSGAPLQWVGPVHLEPLGVYSKKHQKLTELPDGAKIGIANDASNEARGLKLLQAKGLVKVKAGLEATATIRDIQDNPKKFEFIELEAAQLPRSLEDTDASVINGNYAIDAGLKPALDALALEEAKGNPNANGLVTRAELKDDKRIKDLLELLRSQQVKEYIKQKFNGAVLAV
jgi:D-methionine transport system substrate-binding protein